MSRTGLAKIEDVHPGPVSMLAALHGDYLVEMVKWMGLVPETRAIGEAR